MLKKLGTAGHYYEVVRDDGPDGPARLETLYDADSYGVIPESCGGCLSMCSAQDAVDDQSFTMDVAHPRGGAGAGADGGEGQKDDGGGGGAAPRARCTLRIMHEGQYVPLTVEELDGGGEADVETLTVHVGAMRRQPPSPRDGGAWGRGQGKSEPIQGLCHVQAYLTEGVGCGLPVNANVPVVVAPTTAVRRELDLTLSRIRSAHGPEAVVRAAVGFGLALTPAERRRHPKGPLEAFAVAAVRGAEAPNLAAALALADLHSQQQPVISEISGATQWSGFSALGHQLCQALWPPLDKYQMQRSRRRIERIRLMYFPFLAGMVAHLWKSPKFLNVDFGLKGALLSWGRDLSPFMTPIIFMMVVTHAMLMVISLPERLVSLRHKCVINAAVVIFQWCVYGYLFHMASSPPEAIYFIMVTPMIMFLSLAIMPNSHLFFCIINNTALQ